MPINLQGSGNIAEGWGRPPELQAPNIGELVKSILANRLARDKMTQENIADTIKNVRQERQSNEYLEAMKAAGLIPEDYEAGGLTGARLGTGLATMIERKRKEDALEEHRRAMEARIGGRGGGGRGGGGGGGGGSGSAEPQTVWKDGVEWRPGPGGRWIPMKPAAGTKADGETDISKQVKERMNLVDQYDMLEADRKKQEAADIAAGAKDPNYPQKVPFKQSDLYNLTRNRLKQLEEVPGMPDTAPAGTPQPAPAEGGPPATRTTTDSGRPDASKGAPVNVPKTGDVVNGWGFKGGDPNDRSNWMWVGD